MTDLVAFLRARLDDDETEAKATADADEEFWADVKGDGTHFDRWSPARALREVEAKRAILEEECVPAISGYIPERPDLAADVRNDIAVMVLRYLAAVYRDHPDYDPAWE